MKDKNLRLTSIYCITPLYNLPHHSIELLSTVERSQFVRLLHYLIFMLITANFKKSRYNQNFYSTNFSTNCNYISNKRWRDVKNTPQTRAPPVYLRCITFSCLYILGNTMIVIIMEISSRSKTFRPASIEAKNCSIF